MPDVSASCPLCSPAGSDARAAESARLFFDDPRSGRPFFSCPDCRLVFVPPAFHPSPEDEKRRYDLHRNDPADAGYRNHLNRIVEPLAARVSAGSPGLDFGSGPVPVLAGMFRAAGYPTRIYDPFYAPDPSALAGTYDFVTMTEVIEHLREPRRTLDLVWTLVRPGGRLGILTQSPPETETAFARWTYKNDPTHLAFYSRETFERLARGWGARLEFPGRDAAILRRV